MTKAVNISRDAANTFARLIEQRAQLTLIRGLHDKKTGGLYTGDTLNRVELSALEVESLIGYQLKQNTTALLALGFVIT